MNKFKFLSNLKSEKGATGVDIVVSISVIAITIVVITAIYINIDLTSKKVERTAGATRIATNIIEEINRMYYEEFSTELETIYTDATTNATYRYITATKTDETNYTFIIEPKKTSQDVKFFSTRIPKGYILNLEAVNTYGSDTTDKYDIVKNIKISVTYNVGDKTEKTELSTAKSMEIVEMCNTPIFTEESFKFCDSSIKDNVNSLTIIPIKDSGTTYEKTTVNDSEWFNYTNKKWAKILLDASYYNQSTNLVKTGFEDVMYVWIPNFGQDSSGNFGFKYKNTIYKIKEKTLLPKVVSGRDKIVYTVDKATELTDLSGCTFTENGYWIKYSDIASNSYSTNLNSSVYGPLDF